MLLIGLFVLAAIVDSPEVARLEVVPLCQEWDVM